LQNVQETCYLLIDNTFVVSLHLFQQLSQSEIVLAEWSCGFVVKALDTRSVYEDFILTDT